MITPLLKWTGGKSRELPHILPCLLPFAGRGRYIEPFVGGGAVFWAMPPGPSALNDRSRDLIDFYRAIAGQDAAFLACLDQFCDVWEGLDQTPDRTHAYEDILLRLREAPLSLDAEAISDELHERLEDKTRRMESLAARNGDAVGDLSRNRRAAAKSVAYYRMRAQYNEGDAGTARHLAAYVVLKELAYAAMWRTSRLGFNVPFGGLTYAGRDLRRKWQRFRAPVVMEKMGQTSFHCTDFEDFFHTICPTSDDVMFLDPPYDSTFTDYDNASWTVEDQRRLAAHLDRCPAHWLLVIARTPLIDELYPAKRFRITAIDKTYGVEYMGRNKAQRRVEHLLISRMR